MTNQEFEQIYLPKYAGTIRAIARKLAQTNDTLADELYQEGMIAMWACDPKKAKTHEDAYIRQAVKFRMIDCLRREKLNRTESLDAHLENGQQVVEGDDGTTMLMDAQYWRKRRRKRPADGEAQAWDSEGEE